MGSLQSPWPDKISAAALQIDEATLAELFNSQQDHLNYFFQHLDVAQALTFTRTLLSATGTIFFSGVGKSGFVARKISTTLVSLGFPSAFLSPLDALHGDIGALSSGDVLVLLSKSGSSEELLHLAPFARDRGATLVSITSSQGSLLDQCCDLSVFLPLKRELCPFNLAPVTSAAIQMVFGDTVAVALMSARNLTREVYATNHPAGKIGKSLVFKVKDLMKKQDELPLCKEGDMIMDQLMELTSKGCGCLLVINDANRLVGTFTDGDLRRTLKASKEGIFKLTVGEMCNRYMQISVHRSSPGWAYDLLGVKSRSPRTIDPNAMAVEAMKRMESPPSAVQFLPVVDHQNVVIGIITLHGLVSAGL